MARLPTPGQDSGTWGTVLNDFLSQAHQSDGNLKSAAITSAIDDGSLPQSKVAGLTGALSGKLNSSSNLSDVADPAVARTNLSAPKATGFTNITVGTTPPSSPSVGDVWIDTN